MFGLVLSQSASSEKGCKKTQILFSFAIHENSIVSKVFFIKQSFLTFVIYKVPWTPRVQLWQMGCYHSNKRHVTQTQCFILKLSTYNLMKHNFLVDVLVRRHPPLPFSPPIQPFTLFRQWLSPAKPWQKSPPCVLLASDSATLASTCGLDVWWKAPCVIKQERAVSARLHKIHNWNATKCLLIPDSVRLSVNCFLDCFENMIFLNQITLKHWSSVAT